MRKRRRIQDHNYKKRRNDNSEDENDKKRITRKRGNGEDGCDEDLNETWDKAPQHRGQTRLQWEKADWPEFSKQSDFFFKSLIVKLILCGLPGFADDFFGGDTENAMAAVKREQVELRMSVNQFVAEQNVLQHGRTNLPNCECNPLT